MARIFLVQTRSGSFFSPEEPRHWRNCSAFGFLVFDWLWLGELVPRIELFDLSFSRNLGHDRAVYRDIFHDIDY